MVVVLLIIINLITNDQSAPLALLIYMVTFKAKAKLGPLLCDKISITVPLKPLEHQHVISSLDKLKSDGYAMSKYIQKPMYKLNLVLDVGEQHKQMLLVQAQPLKPNMSFLRIEFNPAKVDMYSVEKYLNAVIPDGGYLRAINTGTCTRLDLTVDIHNAELNDILVSAGCFRVTQNYYDKGHLQTAYLGSKSSSESICIYDKAAQLEKVDTKDHVKLDTPVYPITRVEIRLRRRFAAKYLPQIENPFSKIVISRISSKVITAELRDVLILFVHSSKISGAQTSLNLLTPPTRKKVTRFLQSNNLPCWQPDIFWKQWSDVVSKVMPSSNGGPYLESQGV